MFGAGFREALPGAIITAALRKQPDAAPQDGYNAFEDPQVKGTPAEFQYHSQLMGMANPSQTASFLAAAASEERDRQILATSPGGTAVSVVTGLVDPSFFIPIFGEIGAAGKGLSVGVRVARGAAEFAAQSAISEAGLQSAQVTRPMSQSVENVATSAILGGIIGAGGALLSSAERRAAEANLDRVRADFSPQPPREPFALGEPAAAAARVEGAEPATVLAATKPTGESVSYAIDRAAPDAPFTVARDERAPDGAVIPARTGTLDIAGEAHAGDVAHSAAGALTDSGKSGRPSRRRPRRLTSRARRSGRSQTSRRAATSGVLISPRSPSARLRQISAPCSSRKSCPTRRAPAILAIPGGESALVRPVKTCFTPAASPSGRTFLNGPRCPAGARWAISPRPR